MENLTFKTFKEKVFDFEANEEWNFVGEKPAIIDFYADWCGPCKTIAPILEELDAENEDVDFYKINTEEQNDLAAVFHIQSIPSILFIPLEGQPQMAMGAMPKETFKQAIEEILFPDVEVGDELGIGADFLTDHDEVLVAVITDEDGKETIEVVGETEPEAEEKEEKKTEE